jgi:hypothetical protein
MHKFIEKIDTGVADHLSSPGQRLRLSDEALANRIRDILRQVFAYGGNTSMGRIGNDVRVFLRVRVLRASSIMLLWMRMRKRASGRKEELEGADAGREV